jgi:uncharacterized protein (DUF1778 family)
MSKPKSDRTVFLQLRVSPKQRREFQAAAKTEDMDVSQWCRRALMAAAEKAKREARS